jgi:hypothetical protein
MASTPSHFRGAQATDHDGADVLHLPHLVMIMASMSVTSTGVASLELDDLYGSRGVTKTRKGFNARAAPLYLRCT